MSNFKENCHLELISNEETSCLPDNVFPISSSLSRQTPDTLERSNDTSRTGKEYGKIRKLVGMSYGDLAKAINDYPIRVLAFERGLIPLNELPKGFLINVNIILCDKVSKLFPK